MGREGLKVRGRDLRATDALSVVGGSLCQKPSTSVLPFTDSCKRGVIVLSRTLFFPSPPTSFIRCLLRRPRFVCVLEGALAELLPRGTPSLAAIEYAAALRGAIPLRACEYDAALAENELVFATYKFVVRLGSGACRLADARSSAMAAVRRRAPAVWDNRLTLQQVIGAAKRMVPQLVFFVGTRGLVRLPIQQLHGCRLWWLAKNEVFYAAYARVCLLCVVRVLGGRCRPVKT